MQRTAIVPPSEECTCTLSTMAVRQRDVVRPSSGHQAVVTRGRQTSYNGASLKSEIKRMRASEKSECTRFKLLRTS